MTQTYFKVCMSEHIFSRDSSNIYFNLGIKPCLWNRGYELTRSALLQMSCCNYRLCRAYAADGHGKCAVLYSPRRNGLIWGKWRWDPKWQRVTGCIRWRGVVRLNVGWHGAKSHCPSALIDWGAPLTSRLGASCINVAYAQNGHRNVRTLSSKHISGYIKTKLDINMCAWMLLTVRTHSFSWSNEVNNGFKLF